MSNCAIILAGGEGKRMKSDKPKTLSEVLGKPMLWWVMSALKKASLMSDTNSLISPLVKALFLNPDKIAFNLLKVLSNTT